MEYIRIAFPVAPTETNEVLIALLADIGYEGFEETVHGVLAYIAGPLFNEAELRDQIAILDLSFDTEVIPAQNWNALWESNFQPVVVGDFCTVRAHFHDMEVTTSYDIVITPKMSFGTGHHATTQQMISQMRDMGIAGKNVLDFGTGTGILAILAEMLGGKCIAAIDNDEWSVENALENIARNKCHEITVSQGSLEVIGTREFDIVLANINRHILLEYMPMLYKRTKKGGQLLMSGLLVSDKEIMLQAAEDHHFALVKMTEMDSWISILFAKN